MKRLIVATLLFFSFSSVAMALDARVVKDTPASVKEAWSAIGNFCNISSWHPAVEKCVISKKDSATFRTLSLKGGGEILEKLISWDEAKLSYTYTIEESLLPVAGYKSTLKVVGIDGGAKFDWSGTFDAKGASDADAVKTITGVYEAGVEALAKSVTKDSASAIDAVNKEFEAAMSAGDVGRLAKVYTKDGQAFPPNSTVISGRDHIGKFWQGVVDLGIAQVSLKSVELEVLGETAIEVGEFVLKKKDKTTADSGKYIVIWKKENGQWRWHRDIWNSSRASS